jgi:hypothetical protein
VRDRGVVGRSAVGDSLASRREVVVADIVAGRDHDSCVERIPVRGIGESEPSPGTEQGRPEEGEDGFGAGVVGHGDRGVLVEAPSPPEVARLPRGGAESVVVVAPTLARCDEGRVVAPPATRHEVAETVHIREFDGRRKSRVGSASEQHREIYRCV